MDWHHRSTWQEIVRDWTKNNDCSNYDPFRDFSMYGQPTIASSFHPFQLFQMERLQGKDDWEAWEQALEINANMLKVWDGIRVKRPTGNCNIMKEDWDRQNEQAKALLINSISLEIRTKLVRGGFDPSMTSGELLQRTREIVGPEPKPAA